MAAIMLQKSPHANSPVTLCHSRSANVKTLPPADIIIAAMGVAQFLKADMVKPGATVLDVGESHRRSQCLVDHVCGRRILRSSAVPAGLPPILEVWAR